MPNARDIRRRIASITNTRQITKAMEMVASVKMRKAQDHAVETKEYARAALALLSDLSGKVDKKIHPLLSDVKSDRTLVILMTSDKGLCGALNSNVIKKMMEFIKPIEDKSKIDFIAVGKKGRDFLQRNGFKIMAEFVDLGDKFGILDITPIAQIPLDEWNNKKYNKVVLIYNNFVNTMSQIPVVNTLLPITKENIIKLTEVGKDKEDKDEKEKNTEKVLKKEMSFDYSFEPSPNEVLKTLLPRLIEMQVYQGALESNASEHSARMVAMKSANDAASDMIDGLTLSFNQARQAMITKEITEISAGKAALEG
jgi:F-type H+-transporting ATPase subunit gamma